ncbi:MAG: PilZ domain-containing protein [Candidatus Omnitrophica bacterium]|nr:PilZ domain-containing protein [Candidatus Omnitrophota bacterium]MDD5654788.1 PilZ domain-containing protein [Candidatus Omnitrophota bacterium]
MSQTSAERRQYPRAQKQLALKIEADGCDIVTQTENISCVGTYCIVDKQIPVMTKLSLLLLLPLRSKNRNVTSRIHCKGVVVRSDTVSETGKFSLAVFFNEISERNKAKIAQYINQHIV